MATNVAAKEYGYVFMLAVKAELFCFVKSSATPGETPM